MPGPPQYAQEIAGIRGGPSLDAQQPAAGALASGTGLAACGDVPDTADVDRIVRQVFAHFRASAGPKEDRGDHVELLRQLGQGPGHGSIRELVARSYGGREMFQLVERLTTREALLRQREEIFEELVDLPAQVADPLMEVLCFGDVDSRRPGSRPAFAKVAPDARKELEAGVLAKENVDWETALADALRPRIQEWSGLVVPEEEGLCVARERPVPNSEGIATVLATETAGRSITNFGSAKAWQLALFRRTVRNLGSEGGDSPHPPVVTLFQDPIHLEADVLAFKTADRFEWKLPAPLLRPLLAEHGGSPDRLADTFRCWLSALVLDHEHGHVRSGDHLLAVARAHEGSKSLKNFSGIFLEMEPCAAELDLAWRNAASGMLRFHVACTVRGMTEDTPRRRPWHVLELQACFEPDPISWLRDQMRDMEGHLHLDVESFRERMRALARLYWPKVLEGLDRMERGAAR